MVIPIGPPGAQHILRWSRRPTPAWSGRTFLAARSFPSCCCRAASVELRAANRTPIVRAKRAMLVNSAVVFK